MSILSTLLKTVYNTFIDALFPLSVAEKTISQINTEDAGAFFRPALVPPHKNVYAVFSYADSNVARMVWNIKYKRDEHSLQISGSTMFAKIQDLVKTAKIKSPLFLVPLPISVLRKNERGYNQTELIIDAILEINAKSLEPLDMHKKDAWIERAHHTAHQKNKNRSERIQSAEGMFSLNEKPEVLAEILDAYKSGTVLLIDDVVTTGSTLNSAKACFIKTGFENIHALCLAH